MFCNCSGLSVKHLLSFYCQSLLIVSLVCYLKWLTYLSAESLAYLAGFFVCLLVGTRMIKVLLINAK